MSAKLVEEIRSALDDRNMDGYPWEHLGDAARDVRALLDYIAILEECERLAHDASRIAKQLSHYAPGLGYVALSNLDDVFDQLDRLDT